MVRSLSAVAALPAIAFLVVVHGTILATLFAVRFVRRKSYRANRCRQNRKQNFRVIFHSLLILYAMFNHANENNQARCARDRKRVIDHDDEADVDLDKSWAFF